MQKKKKPITSRMLGISGVPPAIIFIDLDNTVLDTSERVYQVYKDILKRKKRNYLSKANYLNFKKGGLPIEEILEKTGAKDISSSFKKERMKKIENPHYLVLDKLPKARRGVLFELKKNYKLVLITLRNHPEELFKQLKNEKIDKIFDKVLVKPGGELSQRWKIKYGLIKNYGDYDSNSFLVGDTETDILAGKKLKIKIVAVTGKKNKNSFKKYKPDFFIKDLSELKHAIFRPKKTI